MNDDLPPLLLHPPRIFASDKWHQCWCDWLRAVYSRRQKIRTVVNYCYLWRNLMDFTKKTSPEDVTRSDIEQFIQRSTHHFKKPPKFGTIGARLTPIQSFYKYAQNYGVLSHGKQVRILKELNPSVEIERPSDESERRAFEVEEARAFLAVIPRNNWRGLRDYAFFLFALLTGRRLSEIANLRWCDFRQAKAEGGQLIIAYTWQGKGRTHKEHLFELPQAVWLAIREYLRYSGRLADMKADSAIFVSAKSQWAEKPISAPSIERLFQKYARAAGLRVLPPGEFNDLTFHSFRAAFICDLLEENGNDLREAALLADHKNINMTEKYARKRKRVKVNRHQMAQARRYL